MNRTPRLARHAALLTALLTAVGVLVWAGPPSLAHPAAGHGTLTEDAQVAAFAAVSAWIVILWLLLAALLSAAAVLPGIAGGVARAIADRVAPVAVRRLVEAALGVALTASLASPPAAFAAPPAPRTAVIQTMAGAPAARSTFALGDRVATVDGADAPGAEPDVAFDRPGLGRPAPKAQIPLAVVQGAMREDATTGDEYVVRSGDSLWSIARHELGASATDAQVEARWHEWYAANRTDIGANPNLISPGMRLVAPDAPTAR